LMAAVKSLHIADFWAGIISGRVHSGRHCDAGADEATPAASGREVIRLPARS
jgi:hypothetical protein